MQTEAFIIEHILLCCQVLFSNAYNGMNGRSPSPEPIYSSDGKRLNTREYRTRKRLEEERHHLIQQMLSLNPDFKPPADYKYYVYLIHYYI
jgi:hypothetical protein